MEYKKSTRVRNMLVLFLIFNNYWLTTLFITDDISFIYLNDKFSERQYLLSGESGSGYDVWSASRNSYGCRSRPICRSEKGNDEEFDGHSVVNGHQRLQPRFLFLLLSPMGSDGSDCCTARSQHLRLIQSAFSQLISSLHVYQFLYSS